jgi:hypothetical protein
MRVAILVALSAALLCTGAPAAERGAAGTRPFVGLWEGVDPGDGSLTQRAITCDRDGRCEVLGSDSFFRLCDGTQGILEGTGSVRDGVLAVPGFTLTCANGARVSVDTAFTPDRRNGTLVEQTANPNIAAITFHRLSLLPRGRR